MRFEKMDKQLLLDWLHTSGLPNDDIWCCSDTALVLHGVKPETSEITVECTAELFQSFIERGIKCELSPTGIQMIKWYDTIDIFEAEKPTTFNVIELLNVKTLDDIIMEKRRQGRDEDLEDIKLIEKFMKEGEKNG